MAPKARTANQSTRGASGRRARQTNLPYPLSSPAAASYRSPPWQQRVDVYAQNYLVPSEIAICRQLGLRYLPTEARLIASQMAGSPTLSLKVRKFIGSLYLFDLAYGLLHDMKSQLRAVLSGGEDVQTDLIENLLNNIRGYRLVKMVKLAAGGVPATGPLSGEGRTIIVDKPWAGTWEIEGTPAALGNPSALVKAEPEINMKVLSSPQENLLRSKGYVILEGMPYSVERFPPIDTRPVQADGSRGGPPAFANYGRRTSAGIASRVDVQMAPYALDGLGGYAVESCINMLIELCNSKFYRTSDFTQQSRLNVFYPLGLETQDGAAIGLFKEGEGITYYANQNAMVGMGNFMGNFGGPGQQPLPETAPTIGRPSDLPGTKQDNVLRAIQVPGSITGATRTQNAAVMEHQRMILTQRDLLGKLGQWMETGEGILAYGGVGFSAYRRGDDHKAVMGNRPATMKYMENNYDNDTCGAGYDRVWYTGQPDDPKSKQVHGFVNVPGVGRVKNAQAKIATCQPVMPRSGHLSTSGGPNVRTDLVYATVPRGGGVVALQKKKKRAARK